MKPEDKYEGFKVFSESDESEDGGGKRIRIYSFDPDKEDESSMIQFKEPKYASHVPKPNRRPSNLFSDSNSDMSNQVIKFDEPLRQDQISKLRIASQSDLGG